MFDNLTDSFHKVADKLEEFGTSTVEYYKLRLFKSSMKGAISLVNLLVYGSLSLFVMLFLSVGAAIWIGMLLGYTFLGFLIIGGFYGVLLVFMFVWGRKMIASKILHTFSGLLYDEDTMEPKKAAEQEMATYVREKTQEQTEEVTPMDEELKKIERDETIH